MAGKTKFTHNTTTDYTLTRRVVRFLPRSVRLHLPEYVLLILGLLYLVLPTGQPTLDAYYYAANVRWTDGDLFFPHHLLHSLPTWLLFQLSEALGLGLEALMLAIAVSALWGVATLAALGKCLKQMGWRPLSVAAGMAFVGLCYAPMRYATDNEAYLAPIALALLGTAHWLAAECGRPVRRSAWLSGLWLALSGAFHQLMVFWWLALALGWLTHGGGHTMTLSRRAGLLLRFALPSLLLLPALYLWVQMGFLGQTPTWSGFLYLVFREYYTGTAPTEFGLHNVLLSVINTVRVFLQVHGYMASLLKLNILWVLPAVLSLAPALWAVRWGVGRLRLRHAAHRRWLQVLGLAAALHFAFAVYNIGNLEFMVMLPALLVLMLAAKTPTPRVRPLLGAALALGIWNVGYGLLPSKLYTLNAAPALAEVVAERPNGVFIIKDKLLVNNILYYHTGTQPGNLYGWKDGLTDSLNRVITRAKAANRPVYTDFVGNLSVVSRAELLARNSEQQAFFGQFTWVPTDSLPSSLGPHRLFQLK